MIVTPDDLKATLADKTWDVCVVGSGPAGLSVVHRLESAGLSVLILESGGGALSASDLDQLNSGSSNLGSYPFRAARARGFGGTSTLWYGACIPLAREDFEARDWVPNSGWPITYDEVAEYYPDAFRFFGIEDPGAMDLALAASAIQSARLSARSFHISAPTDIGPRYRALWARSETVTCVLGATVTDLCFDPTGTALEAVVFEDGTGGRHKVRARHTVLAAGGIETPRILLAANQNGRFGPVGRYYMDHPQKTIGILPIGRNQRDFLPFTNGTDEFGAKAWGTIGLSRERRAQDRLLDMHLRAHRYNVREDQPEIIALKRRALGTAGASDRSPIGPRGVARIASYGAWHLWNKVSASARFDHVRFVAFTEQEPDPDNRITLGSDKDRHGVPFPHLNLVETDVFRGSVARSRTALAAAFADAQFPGARFEEADIAHLRDYDADGLHFMGATRMSASPATGVVDRDCKVHGCPNLSIAGSSVFATGGAANPTLTIVALGLRLGDHLRQTLRP